MINRLSLRNFKKHEKIDVQFGEGLQLITGPNYAGKTTLLHGILYCLGGASQVPGTDIQRRGTNSGFRAEMTFTVEGQKYFVSRTKTTAKLFRGNEIELLCSGTTAVNQHIEQLLGMSFKRFRQLRYAEQKRTDSMLTFGAGELSQIIEELSGVDKIDTAIGRLKDQITFNTGKLEGLQYVDIEGDKQSLNMLTLNCTKAYMEVRECEGFLKAAEEDLEGVTASVRSLRQKESDYKKWRDKKASEDYLAGRYKLDVQNAQKAVEELPEITEDVATLESEYKALKNQIRSVQLFTRALKEQQQSQDDAKHSFESAKKVLAEFIIPKKPTKKQITDQEKKIAAWSDKLVEIRNRLSTLESQLRDGICNTCGSKLAENLDKEATEVEIETLSKQYSTLKQELSDARAKETLFKDQVRDHEAAKERKKDLEQKKVRAEIVATGCARGVADAEADLKKALGEATLEALQTELNSKEDLVGHVRQQLDVRQRKEQELRQCQKFLAEVEKTLKELEGQEPDFSSKALESAIETQDEYRSRQMRHSSTLSKAKTKYHELETKKKALKESVERQEAINKVFEEATKRLDTCKALQKYLRDNRNRYMGDAWAVFMAQASAFVSNCTGGAISQMDRTDDGKFTYTESGHAMQIKSASGAQGSIMGLGVQLALANSIACGLDITLVDEPASDMDDEHSMALSTLLAADGRQVICISHNRMDTSVCSGVVTV